MRIPIAASLCAVLVACSNADQISYSSVGGAPGELSLAPMPQIDAEQALIEGIVFLQTPEDVVLEISEIVLAETAPEIAVAERPPRSKWAAPQKFIGGKAPKAEPVREEILETGSSSIDDAAEVVIEITGSTGGQQTDSSMLQAVLRRNAGQVSYCHNVAKSRYSDVHGRVEIGWTIENGKVQGATVMNNTTGDDRMATCVLSKVMRMEFPETLNVAEVNHPFVFQKG